MTDRIAYGSETAKQLNDGTFLYLPRTAGRCPDCQARHGELHEVGCDVEQCPECSRQLISCDHAKAFLDAKDPQKPDQGEVDRLVDEMETEFFEDPRIEISRERGEGEMLLMRIIAKQLVKMREEIND